MHALAFHNTQFDVVDQSGQPWLRLPQIEGALGYAKAGTALSNIYNRNADEFTSSMTALVELDTAGGKQQVRIFSLRGVHLLAMLSRTKVAKEFRRWVLDVLEGIAEVPAKPKRQPKALPGGLALEQQDAIKALVKARVEDLPDSKRAKAAITFWSALKSKFGCTYKQIAPEHFTDAISLVARVVLEGELLEAEQPAPERLDIHWPAERLAELNPHIYKGQTLSGPNACISIPMKGLCGMDAASPTLRLLGTLARAGYNIEACKLEVLAMRHHLECYWDACDAMKHLARTADHAITLRLPSNA